MNGENQKYYFLVWEYEHKTFQLLLLLLINILPCHCKKDPQQRYNEKTVAYVFMQSKIFKFMRLGKNRKSRFCPSTYMKWSLTILHNCSSNCCLPLPKHLQSSAIKHCTSGYHALKACNEFANMSGINRLWDSIILQ